MINNNGASIRKLSNRCLQNNRMRNIFAVLAIILTGILFTAAFSLTSGAMQAAQEYTMREVGGRFHAGLKAATQEQYEKVTADPMVVQSCYNIFIGCADNIVKRQAELRYTPDESSLWDMFITLEEGRMPEEVDEIVVDTFVLDELGLPHSTGVKIPIRFSFMDETVEEEFVVCGWYQGDAIAHASELFLSESRWMELKGSRTDEDFIRRSEEHPEDRGVGLRAVNLFFENDANLEEKVRTVIRNAGYEPVTELDYGVNWAYMSSRVESVDPFTFAVLLGAVLVILISGYLIIYNIFQISVISDIRFYGLLKTIGTTKRQIRRLVRRQAVMLSTIGIPVGLLVGYGVGGIALPFMLQINDYQGMQVSLQFNPWIFVFGAAFSALTVFLSSRKPGKIAGSVSPIEAVKYTETAGNLSLGKKKRHRRRKRGSGFSALAMAISNFGRNRRTTVVVITAISLSIILLAIIMTAVGSFRIDQYMEQRVAGDFQLANSSVTGSGIGNSDIHIEPEFLAYADAQDGIMSRQEMWTQYGIYLQIDDQAREQLQNLNAQGRLRNDEYSAEALERMLRGEKSIQGYFYGYSEELLSKLTVLDGTLDIDKFIAGDYVLLTQINGNEMIPPEEHVYHPGDMVTLEMVTEDSNAVEITDQHGEVIDVVYENLSEKEYEVMAIVEIPYSMGLNRHAANGCDAVMPLTEIVPDGDRSGETEYGGWGHCFTVSYQVEEEEQEAFEAAVRAYTEQNTQMGYVTQDSLRQEFEGMVTIVATIGIVLAAVIALIGILNFVNAIITGIISRRREFAMLQSIGMTGDQLRKMLICEGISYIAIAGVISFILGSLLSWLILRALNNVILFFEYQFRILPFVVMIPILMLVAALTPSMAYKSLSKKSIVERLHEGE
ncbi:MAG: ABC transporter permease [Lachnospiraceae bacterium]|nr:ABC transporter permease [Lachnospiraceae bacterium]